MSSAVLGRIADERRRTPAGRGSLWAYARKAGLSCLVVGTSKDPNAKRVVLLVSPASGRPVLAVKVPTTDVAARAVEAEERLLTQLGDAGLDGVTRTIPAVVDVVDFDGRPALVMTAVAGTPMSTSYLRWRHTASRTRVAADFAIAERWLDELRRATAGQLVPMEMDGGVGARLRARFSEDELLAADLARLAAVHARLRRDTVSSSAVHGDFWFGNVLVAGGTASGVVDWEGGTLAGVSAHDLVRFGLMYALYLDHRTRPRRLVAGHPGLRAGEWGAGVEFALTGEGWFPELFRGFLRRGLAGLGASPSSWRDAALAGIAEVAAFTDNPGFARRQLELFRRLSRRQSQGGAAL